MKAIYSNARISESPAWAAGCAKEHADRVTVIDGDKSWTVMLSWKLLPRHFPEGWDFDLAMLAIKRLLEPETVYAELEMWLKKRHDLEVKQREFALQIEQEFAAVDRMIHEIDAILEQA
jgi:hypothetical protein